MTVNIQNATTKEVSNAMTVVSQEDRDENHPDPCDCWYFRDVTNV